MGPKVRDTQHRIGSYIGPQKFILAYNIMNIIWTFWSAATPCACCVCPLCIKVRENKFYIRSFYDYFYISGIYDYFIYIRDFMISLYVGILWNLFSLCSVEWNVFICWEQSIFFTGAPCACAGCEGFYIMCACCQPSHRTWKFVQLFRCFSLPSVLVASFSMLESGISRVTPR